MSKLIQSGVNPLSHSEDLFSSNGKQQFDLGFGAEIVYWRCWFGLEQDALMKTLVNQLPWEQPAISVAGKTIPIPRLQCWFGDPQAVMRYSGKTFQPLAWNKPLAKLRDRVTQACGEEFNSVLINLYRTGQDSVGWHADDEPELGRLPAIASLSLGARRSFQLKPKNQASSLEKNARISFDLGEGDLLLMRGKTQQYWQHAVPKTKKAIQPRINMTFRLVYNSQ